MIAECTTCGDEFSEKRMAAGYTTCLVCGEKEARKKHHTVVPMHKSNYISVANIDDLKNLNKNANL